MISRKTSSLFTTISTVSSKSSIYPSSDPACDADNLSEDGSCSSPSMSADDSGPTRPLTVNIPRPPGTPSSLHCTRRPNLRDILANISPPPFTLTAFMAYLSHNHCLETLEFTMDAGRYQKHYAKMMSKAEEDGLPPAKDREYVQLLWNRLIDAYIRPNGSREVNLPSDVRDPLLRPGNEDMPPLPEKLDLAVKRTYELMEESVLVPFINSTTVHMASSMPSSEPTASTTTSVDDSRLAAPSDPNRPGLGRYRQVRSSPPPSRLNRSPTYSSSAPVEINRNSASASPTASHTSNLSNALKHGRFSIKFSPNPTTTSSPASSPSSTANTVGGRNTSHTNLTHMTSASTASYQSPGAMTDDNGSTGSPTNDSPMTPPMSPPNHHPHHHHMGSSRGGSGDLQTPTGLSGVTSPGTLSPRQQHGAGSTRDSGMWKKFSRLSGMKVHRKKSQADSLNREDQ